MLNDLGQIMQLILYGKLKGRLLNVFFVLIFYFRVQFFGFNSKQARIDYR
jgi:hypothetical protein